MGIVKVNRTGKKYNVYRSNACNSDEIIGTIYNNEVFTWTGEWSGSSASGYYVQSIVFRNSDGEKDGGWVVGEGTDAIFSTNLSEMAAKKVTVDGKSYYAFKMRRDSTLYDKSGNRLKKTAYKNRYILTEGSTSGVKNPGYLAVKYVESGVGTNDYTVIETGRYAFVYLQYYVGSTMGSDFLLIGKI